MNDVIDNTVLKDYKFAVVNEGAVGLNKLCDQLTDALPPKEYSLPPNVPLSLTVTYCLNAIACAPRRFKRRSWHLKAPSPGSVLIAVQERLELSGFLTTNQIVAATVVKAPTDSNELIIEIRELDAPSYEDRPRIEHRVLEYYLEQCSIKGKTPTYKAYSNLLKKLKHKAKSKKQSEAELLSKVLKNYGNTNITE